MRRIFDWVVLIAVLGGAGVLAYTHQTQVRGMVSLVQNKVAPCSQPLTYSIGAIDPGFGISKSILLADLKDAENIWETASGKNLFSYVPSGGEVTISLVYDARQAATDRLHTAGIQVDTSEASYHVLKSQYDALAAQVKNEQSGFDAQVAAYKRDESAYNAEVQQANSGGGASSSEYARLQADKSALEQEFASVKSLEANLNAHIDTLNAMATTLNQLIVQLNLNVAQYNQTGASAGEFEEGLYQLSGGVQTIQIYEYANHVQLVRVLAHEMGHALGLEHVKDPQAIMYEVNKGTLLTATAADRAELARACTAAF